MAFYEPFEIASPTGAKLSVRLAAPQGPAPAIVHINHGLAEHSARYHRFADALVAAGFAVIAHDHRGHGLTKADDAGRGVFSSSNDGIDHVMADCAAVQTHAAEALGPLPVIMFGHSMGGLITMNYALRHADRLAGAAIWNSNFTGGMLGRVGQLLLGYERMRLGSDVASQIMPKLTFQDWAKKIDARRTDFDWLSRMPDEVDAYINDPDCGWDASVSLWQDIFKMVFAGGRVDRVQDSARALPFMLVGGGHDPATFGGKAVNTQANRMRGAGFSSVLHKHYPDARHETLNDLDADRAIADFVAWTMSVVEAA
ncbi:MAG: alpha/beta hydrolase [Pseudomonadota bacterium]